MYLKSICSLKRHENKRLSDAHCEGIALAPPSAQAPLMTCGQQPPHTFALKRLAEAGRGLGARGFLVSEVSQGTASENHGQKMGGLISCAFAVAALGGLVHPAGSWGGAGVGERQ